VIGTGKRVGKTAVTAHVARLLARDRRVVVVSMGRGGPAEPELVSTPPGLDDLVARSRAGRHAASDHLETAALTGLPTIGCRRAGGGLAGAPFTSNVLEGARLAESLEPDLVVFDGSGAAIPPVAADARILVAHDLESGLNPYRALISDLVLRVGVDFTLRLRPAEPLHGRVAVFTAGAAETSHLEADVVHVSHNLARRDLLREELEHIDADTYLVELKAAAIDVVAEHALARGAALVLAENDVVAEGFDEAVLALVPQGVRA
jgi:cyclic 2,3-diphosphoglycerate synthetase